MYTLSRIGTCSSPARLTRVRWISRPVKSPANAVRRKVWAPKNRWEIRPSGSRANAMP